MTAQHAIARTQTNDVEPGAASRVLELLEVRDLQTLRERHRRMSPKQSADLLLPVVVTLAAEYDDEAGAHREVQPALGVVLYQLLIRQRLAGTSVDAVIEQVMSGEYKRPRELERSIPRSLEAIITRTLRYSAEERFDSLRDLGAALLPFASKHVQRSHVLHLGPSISTARRGAKPFMTPEALEAQRVQRRGDLKLVVGGLAVVVLFVLAQRQGSVEPAAARKAEPAAEAAPAAEAQAAAEPARELAHAEAAPAAEAKPASEEAAPERAPRRVVEAPRAAAAASSAALADASGTYAVDLTVQPGNAWIMLDHKAAGSGRLRRKLARDGKAHELHVGAPGYKVQALRFQDASPPASVVLEKRAR